MAKILYISTNSDEAGAPRHCELILQEVRKNHDVFFVTGEKGAVYWRLIGDGVRCVVIPGFRNSISPFKDIFVLYKLFLLICEIKPDLIHLHSAKAGLIGRLCGFFCNIPTVYTVHGFPWRGMSAAKKILIVAVEKLFARIPAINYILVSNEQMFDAVYRLKIPSERIEVIHNGVSDIEGSLIKTHVTNSFKTIIMVARVCAAKDHITLLKAFSSMDGSDRLMLCGQGTDSDDFINLTRRIVGDARLPFVDFLGERNDVSHLLSQADVFVLSSNFEALPISIIEAMRAGLPIVATDVGGVRELVAPDCGYTFNVGDVLALKGHLIKLNDSHVRTKLGAAGRSKYLEQLSEVKMMKRLNKMYIKLLMV